MFDKSAHRDSIVGGERCFFCGHPATARGECAIGNGWKDGRPAEDVAELVRDINSFGSQVVIHYFACAEHIGPANEVFMERKGVGGGYVFEGELNRGAGTPAYARMAEIVDSIPTQLAKREDSP